MYPLASLVQWYIIVFVQFLPIQDVEDRLRALRQELSEARKKVEAIESKILELEKIHSKNNNGKKGKKGKKWELPKEANQEFKQENACRQSFYLLMNLYLFYLSLF